MDIRAFHGRYGFEQSRSISGHNVIGNYIKYSNLNWKSIKDLNTKISVFTDGFLRPKFVKKNSKSISIGLALEPNEINPRIVSDLVACENYLDLILTHDKTVLKTFPQARYYVAGGTYFKNEDTLSQSPKRKKISLVLSRNKDTEGHLLRPKVLELFSEKFEIDIFGTGYNPFEDRKLPYAEYSYSIVIENVKSEVFFTEKIIDPLLMKSVPIYWGAEKIGNFFDNSGILEFSDLAELEAILIQIKDDSMKIDESVINRNQITAVNYMSKEWNIQSAIYRELFQVELPDLSSLITDFPAFISGKDSFKSAEPRYFFVDAERERDDIGFQSRLHFLKKFAYRICPKISKNIFGLKS